MDTRPVPNVMRAVLLQIIRQKVPRGSTIYSDGFRSYAGLLTIIGIATADSVRADVRPESPPPRGLAASDWWSFEKNPRRKLD